MRNLYRFFRETKRIHLVLMICLSSFFAMCQTLDSNVPTGFAIVNANSMETTTGGGNGNVVTVKTLSDLTAQCGKTEALVIIVEGTISGSNPVTVKSNKTIIGKGTNAKLNGVGLNLSGVSNIIIRNLTITGSADGVAARNTHHLWVDHCDIYDNGDGLLDITQESSYCSVTWCKFYYVNQTEHRLACLIGSGGGDHPEDWNNLKVTYHHNWYDKKVDQRMPRIMYGQGHVFNDYYTCTSNSYCIGIGSYGAALIENNYFKGVANPHQLMYDIYCWVTARGNVYDNTTGKKDNGKLGSRDVSVVEWAFPVAEFKTAPYLYTLDKAADVPALVGDGSSVDAAMGDIGLIPAPGQGAINVKNPTLKWTKGTIGRTATSYKVYLGTSTNPALVSTVTAQSYNPGTLIAGTVYYWRVDMVTPTGTIAGKLWQFKTDGTAPANTPPTVNITSPSNNASFTAPASIIINANATDANGSVANVQFYNGTTLLGSDDSSPYSYTWSNVAAGSYTITAKATDNLGVETTSSPVALIVNSIPTDCNGTPNGTATLDNCGRCIAGTTGKTACSSVAETETEACAFDGITETKNVGYKGTSYLNVDNAVGTSISFNIIAENAGAATLSFRYANGGTADRAAQISVNGTVLPSNLSFPVTGTFTDWKAVDLTLTFVKGTNVVKLISTTAEGLANIDQIGYVSSGVSKGGCVVTGIDFDIESSVIEVFPNPSTTQFTIQSKGDFKYQILDLKGFILHSGEATNTESIGEELSQGIYILKIENASGKRVVKIAKN